MLVMTFPILALTAETGMRQVRISSKGGSVSRRWVRRRDSSSAGGGAKVQAMLMWNASSARESSSASALGEEGEELESCLEGEGDGEDGGT